MKTPKMVLVTWHDANRFHGWQDPEDLKAHLGKMSGSLCKSIGFLVHEDVYGVGLAESVCWTEQVGCTIWIPRGTLLSMQRIKKEKKNNGE